MTGPADRLAALGLTLPPVTAPVAAYVCNPADRSVRVRLRPGAGGGREAGSSTGKVGAEVSTEEAAQMARTCALNGLAAAASVADGLGGIRRIVKIVGFRPARPASAASRR